MLQLLFRNSSNSFSIDEYIGEDTVWIIWMKQQRSEKQIILVVMQIETNPLWGNRADQNKA